MQPDPSEIVEVTREVLSGPEFTRGEVWNPSYFTHLPSWFWYGVLAASALLFLTWVWGALRHRLKRSEMVPVSLRKQEEQPPEDPIRRRLWELLKKFEIQGIFQQKKWKTNSHYVEECKPELAREEIKAVSNEYNQHVFGKEAK